jgi:hypothetical protein
MVSTTIRQSKFPIGFTQGLITLLSKGGEKEDFNNLHPITLFNVSYKIFAKAF